MMSVFALALTGAFVASAGAYAAENDTPLSAAYWQPAAAVMGPTIALGPTGQRDVIEPPSSIDPGMALDPPAAGEKMPIIHPPGTVDHRMVLPR